MQTFQEDLQKLGLRIKQHEYNIKFLKTQKNSLADSILDMQGMQYFHSFTVTINGTGLCIRQLWNEAVRSNTFTYYSKKYYLIYFVGALCFFPRESGTSYMAEGTWLQL